EDPQRLLVRLADEVGVAVAAADVGEAAYAAENSPELIGAFPGDRERADTATTPTADRALVWVIGDDVSLLDCREDFGQHELCVGVAQRVVFDATVLGLRVPPELLRELPTEDAGVDKDTDCHRHLAAVDEVVEHDGGTYLTV